TSGPSSRLPSTKGTSSGTKVRCPLDRSSSTTTSSPWPRNACTTCAPMYPAPPVTIHVMARLYQTESKKIPHLPTPVPRRAALRRPWPAHPPPPPTPSRPPPPPPPPPPPTGEPTYPP